MALGADLYERFVFSPLLSLADKALSRVRGDLLREARGRVLELGIGSGLSLPYYRMDGAGTPRMDGARAPRLEGTESRGVTELVGLEPSATLLDQCRERLEKSHSAPPTTLVQASAESLPWPDDHFDTVVAFLVFCTIADPEQAIREVRRVLKPGGQLLFFEHVAAQEPGLARWQRRVNPLWRHMACGCQLTRDTRRLFLEAGFPMEPVPVRRHPDIPLPLLSPTISGAVTHGG